MASKEEMVQRTVSRIDRSVRDILTNYASAQSWEFEMETSDAPTPKYPSFYWSLKLPYGGALAVSISCSTEQSGPEMMITDQTEHWETSKGVYNTKKATNLRMLAKTLHQATGLTIHYYWDTFRGSGKWPL